jgi:Fic family protein
MKQTLSLIITSDINEIWWNISKFPAKNLQYYQVLSFASNLKKEKIFFQLFTQREFIKHLQKRVQLYGRMDHCWQTRQISDYLLTFGDNILYCDIIYVYKGRQT